MTTTSPHLSLLHHPHNISKTALLITYIRSLWFFALRPFLLSIYESLAIWRIWRYVWYSPELFKHAKHCFYLNGLAFLGSVFLFNWILQPSLHFMLTIGYSHPCENWYFSNPDLETCTNDPFSTFETFLTILYNFFWTIPVYITSLIANGLWYQKIVNEVARLQSNPKELQSSYIIPQQVDPNQPQPTQPQSLDQVEQQQQPSKYIFKHVSFLRQRALSNPAISTHHSSNTQSTSPNYTPSESAFSPMRALSLIGENLSRIAIFILLLIQATILSLFSFPSIFSSNIIAQSPSLWFINSIWVNIPLILSYALTSISYTYVMFEYTWSTPAQQQEQLFSYHAIPPQQQELIKQLQVLRDEHDLTQLHCRFLYTERRMFYFIGFSFVLTISTFSLPILLSLALFNLLFPFFLLTSLFAGGHMTMLESQIIHLDNTNDSDDKSAQQQLQRRHQTVERIYQHNQLITPPRFFIFGPARWANDVIFIYLYQKVKSFWRQQTQ